MLQQDLTAKNLARYPVVILPSVMTLADADISELRRYVDGGGCLVATGETGTRYGPERYLAPREPGFSLPGTRIVVDKPGVTYWRKDRDAAAARRRAELLDWPGWTSRLETDAPATVGGNLNVDKGIGNVLRLAGSKMSRLPTHQRKKPGVLWTACGKCCTAGRRQGTA